jgi:hypothetical protein
LIEDIHVREKREQARKERRRERREEKRIIIPIYSI